MSIVFSGNNTVITSGVLPIEQGGTSGSTREQAINNLLPDQQGNLGLVLKSDGTDVYWASADETGGIPDPTGKSGYFLSTDGTDLTWSLFNATGLAAAGNPGQLQYNDEGAIGATSRISYNGTNILFVGTGATDTFTIQGAPTAVGTSSGSTVEIKGGDPILTADPGSYLPAGDVVLTGGRGFGDAAPGKVVIKVGNNGTEVVRVTPTGAISFGNTGANVGVLGQVLTSTGPENPPTWTSLPIASTAVTGIVKIGDASGLTVTAEGVLSSLVKDYDPVSITIDEDGVISANLSNALPPLTNQAGKLLSTNGEILEWVEANTNQLLPSQDGQDGKFLGSDGTNAGWRSVFPTQTGNEGKFLTTNGTTVGWSTLQLPLASDTVLGGVKVDGITIVADSNGVITATAALYDLPIAGVGAAGVLGGIRVGETLSIDSANGLLNVGIAGQGLAGKIGGIRAGDGLSVNPENGLLSMAPATTNTLGGVKVDGVTVLVDTNGVLSVTGASAAGGYLLPTASAEIKGGIKVGNNLVIDENTAVLNAVFPQATDLTLGAIKVGNGLAMDSETGKLNVNIPQASTIVAGLVKVDGTSIVINETTGVISATASGPGGYTLPIAGTAPAGNLGGVKIGSGLSIDGATGILTLATASDTVLGGVKVDGTSITIADGVISASGASALPSQSGNEGKFLTTNGSSTAWSTVTVPSASTTQIGGVKVDGSTITIDGDSVIKANVLALLPNLESGKFLTTNGVELAWSSTTSSIATPTDIGAVSPDGVTISVTPAGTISARALQLTQDDQGKLLYVNNGFSAPTPSINYSSDNLLVVGGSNSPEYTIQSVKDLMIKGVDAASGINAGGNVTIRGGDADINGPSAGDVILQAGSGKGDNSGLGDSGDVLIKAGVTVNTAQTTPKVGGKISFFTGSTTTLVERLSIQNNGSWMLGGTSTGSSGQPLVSNGGITAPSWGIIGINFGGTGATTPAGARVAILPTMTDNNGKFLTTNGNDASWATISIGIDPTTTGLTFSGGPIKSAGTFTVGGVLALEHGGTGKTTANEALNNLLPAQSGNANSALITNGSNAIWSPITSTGPLPVATTTTLGGVKIDGTSIIIDANGVITATGAGFGTVTSVTASGGVTGLTFSGGPVTTTGTLTLGGVLRLENGGTGGTTKLAAQNAILPDQLENQNKVLMTNGDNVYWSTTVLEAQNSITAETAVNAITAETITTVLPIEKGGTGKTTKPEAINNLLPSQSGKYGKFLSTNGENVSWQDFVNTPTSGTEGGVQFNNSGFLASATKMIYNAANNLLTIGSYGTTFNILGANGGVLDGAPRTPASIVLRPGNQSAANASSGSLYLQGGNTVGLDSTGGTVYIDGGTSTMSTGGSVIIRTTEGAGTSLTNRLQIKQKGVWLVNGSSGVTGQVLTSQGPDLPPVWAPGGAAAIALTGDTLAPNVIYSSLTTLGTLTSLKVAGNVGIGTAIPLSPLVVAAGDNKPGIEFIPGETVSKINAIDRATNLPSPLEIGASNIALRTESDGNLTTRFEIKSTGEILFNGVAGTVGQYLKAQGPNLPPTWGGVSINDLEGVVPITKGGTGADNAVVASQNLVNYGQLRSHTAVTAFNLVQQWGDTFVKGNTNGPDTGTEYYQSMYSLGSDYNWGSGGVYAMQTAIPRNSIKPYLSVRFKEGGGNSSNWTTWRKIYAGYADTAASLEGILPIEKGGTGQSTRQAAINVLSGFAGTTNQNRVLRNDGTNIVLGKLQLGTDVDGVLDISNGGTGQTSRQAAINALSGTLVNNTVLRSDGSNVTLSKLKLDTDVANTLQVSNGGTGATYPRAALNNLLPTQGVSNAGKVLKTNGDYAEWSSSVTSVNASGGVTGLNFSGGPITSSGTLTLTGTLNVSNGGTGRTSLTTGAYLRGNGTNAVSLVTSIPASDLTGTIPIEQGGTEANSPYGARKNILPSYSGNANLFLRVNSSASDVYWSTIAADASTLSGQVPVANGGTGASTPAAARFNLLPSYGNAANAGKVLTLNPTATDVTWATPVTLPGGSTTQVQFNNNGAMAGSAAFTFNNATGIANFTNHPTIGGTLQVGYRNLPRVTTLNTDAVGKRVALSAGVTIAANTYQPGDAISFYNTGAAAITITAGSGLTLRKDGTASTGNFVLAGYGTAFLWFNTTTEAVLSGSIT